MCLIFLHHCFVIVSYNMADGIRLSMLPAILLIKEPCFFHLLSSYGDSSVCQIIFHLTDLQFFIME